MKHLLPFILILSFHFSFAQTEVKTDSVYRVVSIPAEFPGGRERMSSYINFRLKSDQSTWDVKEGILTVEFIVETDGRIKEVNVLKSLDPTFDDNFIRLIRSMPKWEPAKLNGRPVRSYYTISYDMNYVMN